MPHRTTDLHHVKTFGRESCQDFSLFSYHFYYLKGFHVYCDGKLDSQVYHKGHQHTKAAFKPDKSYILAMLFQTYLVLY